jgi:hypothetical protein
VAGEEHRRVRDLLGPYVLGALDPVEEMEVRHHLRQCPRCDEEERDIRQAHEYMTDLATAAETPPPTLKHRSLRATRRRSIPVTPLAAVAAVLLVLLGLAAAYSSGFFATREAAATTLQPTELAPEAGGELRVDRADPNVQAELEVWNLPRLQQDEYYELWFGKENGRVSAGTFTVDESGRCTLQMSVPAETVGDYERVGITVEKFPEEPRMDEARVVLGGELRES